MGTLPIIMIKGFRLKILPAENDHHHRFPILVFVIALMIGMQAPMINCSGDVNLRRPYLFRDYEMLTGYGPQHSQPQHHHVPSMFKHQEKSSSPPPAGAAEQYSAESVEDGSSEEGEDTQQYTAPIIVDIDIDDDPEMKARWMGLSDHDEQFSEEYDEDEEEEQRSLSSTEFQSRSSQQIGSSSNEKTSDSNNGKNNNDASGSSARGDSDNRGIMDNFSFNPFSYWQGDSEDDTQGQQDTELPQSDETPEYAFYPYAFDTNPSTDYYYDPGSEAYHNQQQNDQKRPIMPHLVPMQMMPQPPKPKPKKPKPVTTTTKKPKQKKPKQKPKPKPKPMQPPPPGGMMMPKPMKVKRPQQYSHQFHYQEFEKPDKLSIISEKLSKLNPFRYVQIQKPQIKIQKIPAEQPHPQGMHQHAPPGPPPPSGRPPPKVMKKPKRPPQNGPPPPPKRKPKPPSMMQAMMNKMKPKPKQPKPKQKQPKKPHGDEANPEFVMIFGEPFGDFSSSEIKGIEGQDDYRNDGDDDEDEEDEDNDEEDEEDDGDDDEDEEDLPQVTSITHGQLPSGEMTDGEAVVSSDDGEADDDDADDAETSQPVLVEDDEGDYEDGVIGLTSSGTSSGGGSTGVETGEEDADQKEKSGISFTKIFGWRKKKKRRRHHPHHRPGPAKRPPNWKQYRPAPLIRDDFGVSDAILKVVKNVGFLPEYDKTEKYGGHNKIKGKFTKTRPITFHSGLVTQVLRRRR